MGNDPARRDAVRQWAMRSFRTVFDKKWQLAKVEMMLRSPHCSDEWRDNLLDQQAVLTDAIAMEEQQP